MHGRVRPAGPKKTSAHGGSRRVGQLGFVVYVPELGEFLHSSSDIPQHILDMFVRNKQKIGQCKISAANVPYYSLLDLFRAPGQPPSAPPRPPPAPGRW